MKYHALLVLFFEKQQKLKFSSAANYKWPFMGYGRIAVNSLSLHPNMFWVL